MQVGLHSHNEVTPVILPGVEVIGSFQIEHWRCFGCLSQILKAAPVPNLYVRSQQDPDLFKNRV